MTTQPNSSNSDDAPVSVTAGPRDYLYLVSFDTGSRRGYLYLPLSFKIESVADVNRVREELRWQGLDFAIIMSFTYLPGGWGQR
jgi:hypothetical protein